MTAKRLTEMVDCAGCAAKLAPGDLAQVLSTLPKQAFDNVIVGFDTADDAGVLRLTDDIALVQTTDFFTPVADDPEIYGRAAAVNALNDVYAMGGTPVSALSLVCYPQKGDWEILGAILRGGQAAMNDDGVPVLGGHSVDDKEIKFGYAVTGTVDPRKVITNAGAMPGDRLFLTKPIGTGAINTAVKKGLAGDEAVAAVIKNMTSSLKGPSKAMVRYGASAATDVTGFGLLGHAYEMAKGSDVTIEINAAAVPLLPDVRKLVEQGMLTRGDRNNRAYVGNEVTFSANIDGITQSILFDPQTAGGLLVAIAGEGGNLFAAAVPEAVEIGNVVKREDNLIRVV